MLKTFYENKYYIFFSITFLVSFIFSSVSNPKLSNIVLKCGLSIAVIVAGWFFLKSNESQEHRVVTIPRSIIVFLTVVVFVLLLSSLLSANSTFGLIKLSQVLIAVIPLIFTGLLLTTYTGKTRINVFGAILAGFILLFLVGILILNPFKYNADYKLNLANWSHVTLGRFFSFTSVVLCVITARQKQPSREFWFFLIASLAAVWGVYLTGLRAGILGLYITTPVMLVLLFRRKPTNKTYFAIVLMALLAAHSICTFYYSGQRAHRAGVAEIVSAPGKTNDDAVNVRWELYKSSIEMIRERPLLGWGFGGFRSPEKGYLVYLNKYPHNVILEIATEFGIIILLVVMALLLYVFKAAYSRSPLYFSLLVLAFWLSLFSKDIASNGALWLFCILSFYKQLNISNHTVNLSAQNY